MSSDSGLKCLPGQIEKSGRTNTQEQRGASAVLKGFFFCFSITSKGILLFCPVSLNACASRKTSSTPTPRARNGKTCGEDTAQWRETREAREFYKAIQNAAASTPRRPPQGRLTRTHEKSLVLSELDPEG